MSEKRRSIHHVDLAHRDQAVAGQPETEIVHTDSDPGGVPAVAVKAVTVLAVETQPDQFAFRPDDN